MRYETLIGLRYTRAQPREGGGNRFVSFISMISLLGLALGIAALIVVLSVMNGFQTELRTRILGVVSHVQITGEGGQLANWPAVLERVKQHPRAVGAAPFVQEQGMLSAGDVARGVVVRGILPEREGQVAEFDAHMRGGKLADLRPGEFGIVLGAELARSLRVAINDKVTLMVAQGLVTPAAVLPRVKQFRVVGIFDAGMYEFDSGLSLMHLEDAQRLFRLGDDVSGVRLRLDDLFAAPQVAREIAQGYLDANAWVSDWTRSHANFFRAVEIEKRMMFLILLLIVAVAAFNIVSTLVMAVQDKRADIAILRTLGASPRSVMGIFIVQGATSGVIGTLGGLLLGLGVALNIDVIVPALERLFHTSFLPSSIYLISKMPSEPQAADIVPIGLISLALAFLATLYPSWRASRVNPAEALRYE